MDDIANDSEELGDQLRTAVWSLYRRLRSQRSDGALGDTALAVLSHLEKYGPLTLTELSAHDHVAPASMSQSVNRLAAAGYAVRTPDPIDGRKVLFTATEEGAAFAVAARGARHAWLDDRLSALSADDRRVLARASELLGQIADELSTSEE